MVVLEARMSQYGLTLEQARHQAAEGILGILWLRGKISEPEREAGERIETAERRAMAALNAPARLQSGEGPPPGDGTDTTTVDRDIRAVSLWRVYRQWLVDEKALPVWQATIGWRAMPTDDDLVHLRRGLRAAASRMGLDSE